MSVPHLNLDHLASRLEPIAANILEEGGTFAELLGTELSKKASGSLVGTAINTVQSLGKAVWKTIRSSKAHKRFQRRWNAASSPTERQQAVRQFLDEDPKRAQSLYALLSRLDFLRAVVEHAEQLPNIALLDTIRRLSEVYVPIGVKPNPNAKHSDYTEVYTAQKIPGLSDISTGNLLGCDNHIVEGAPGSGKSTLARWLVASEARSILDNKNKISFDQIRLPVLVSARSLQVMQSDFATALQRATNLEMSVTGFGPLPNQFFLPYSEFGHKSWLVVIDGLDEIEDIRERQRLWDALSRLHSQIGDSFRFIVFTRPNSIQISQDEKNLRHWHICSPTRANRKLIAQRYIDQNEKVDKFLFQTEASALSEVYKIPLFESVAASIFSHIGSMPTSEIGLCEAFISLILDKLSIQYFDKTSIIRLLMLSAKYCNIESPEFYAYLKDVLPKHTSHLQAEAILKKVLRQIGIVIISGRTLSFIHDVFRSYFLAMHIAFEAEPNSNVWNTVDPFRVGWTTSRYVCEKWALMGRDISRAVDALLSFGDDGEKCAIDLSVSCSIVSEKVVGKITHRIFREMQSTGPTISGVEALTRLSARRASVKKRLIDAVYFDDNFLEGRLQCAECLLDAGYAEDGLNALEFIAKGKHEYHGDRIRAASLLLENNRKKPALKILREMAQDADELRLRVEAAVNLLKADRSGENRQRVADLLGDRSEEDLDIIDEKTLALLMSFGEIDIALPLIRYQAKPPVGHHDFADIPRSQIEACKAIAAYHDGNEATSALKSLLFWQNISLRGKAEVLQALADIGMEDDARNLLRQSIGDGPEYDGADWFLLETLERFGLEEELRVVGLYLLQRNLETPSGRGNVRGLITRLLCCFELAELAELIRTKLQTTRDSDLALCLATLGFRNEALNLLKSWTKSGDHGRRIDSAERLCFIGERRFGVRTLKELVKDYTLAAEVRLKAAYGLERVNEVGAAEKAYLLLLQDGSLSIEERGQVAGYLDKDIIDRSVDIWEVMFPQFIDDKISIQDRISIARVLMDTSDSGWSEYNRDDLIDELLSMLETRVMSVPESWSIVDVLARARFPFSDIPGAVALTESPSIPVNILIEGLQKFVLWNNDEVAAEKLIKIAQTSGLTYAYIIDALSAAGTGEAGERARDLLGLISEDPTIPPAWRLKAASQYQVRRHSPLLNKTSISIVRDAKVSIRIRLATLRDLKPFSVDQQAELLSEMATTPQLTSWDRLDIAEAALEVKEMKLVEALLKDAQTDVPHSIAEMTKMAELFHAIGNDRHATSLLEQITKLQDIILKETEEQSSAVEAANLLAELGYSERAKHFLLRVIELVSWHNAKDILDSISRIAGENEARQAALKLLPELVTKANDPSSDYMGYWRHLFEEFLVKGWTTDLEPLLLVAKNPSKILSDRAEAAAAIYRNSSCDASQNWTAIAQCVLVELSERKDFPVRARVGLIPILNTCDLENLAKRCVDTLAGSQSLDAEDSRSLAKLLVELGDKKRAKEVLNAIGREQETTGFLGPWDERLIKELQGEDHFRFIQLSRTFNEQEPIIDRLLEARDMVSEYGEKRALQFIFDTAYDRQLDPNDRLQAVEAVEELGYRDILLKLLPDILSHPELDDFWAGDLLLRFGSKAEALERFQMSIKSCPKDYRDQIARRLADLQAITLLAELNESAQ